MFSLVFRNIAKISIEQWCESLFEYTIQKWIEKVKSRPSKRGWQSANESLLLWKLELDIDAYVSVCVYYIIKISLSKKKPSLHLNKSPLMMVIDVAVHYTSFFSSLSLSFTFHTLLHRFYTISIVWSLRAARASERASERERVSLSKGNDLMSSTMHTPRRHCCC